jgi:hypothetical protein
MMITRRTAVLATALALIGIQSAGAQRRTRNVSGDNQFEIGMDAALGFANSNTVFQLPVQAIRFGYFVSPTVSIEPTLGLTTGSGLTLINFDVGVPFDLTQTDNGGNIFLRPLFGLAHQSFSGGLGSNTTTSLGDGAGILVPMMSHFDSRFEARYRRWFGNNGFNEVDLLAGVSVMLP